MARFITAYQKQENIQAQSPIVHYMLLMAIVMEIITLPKLPVINVAPINIVLLIATLMVAINFRQLPKLHPAVIRIILLLLFFDLYDYGLGWALNKQYTAFPVDGIRKCIELTLFAFACTSPTELKRTFFTINSALVTSALFGLLIYHIGEPFQSIRNWLLQNTDVKSGISGKGLWVSGLSGQHFLFGYVLAAAPVVTLICSRLSRTKWIWHVLLVLLFYTLYLNAERAALIGALLGVAYLIKRWQLVKPIYVSIGIAAVLTVFLLKSPSSEMKAHDDTEHRASLAARIEGADSLERLHWLNSGVISVLNHPFAGVTQQDYAEVFFDRHLVILNSPDRETVPPHNHYVDTGLNIGVLGWIVMLLYLWVIKDILKQVFNAKLKEPETKMIFEGIPVALISVMTVSLFHNSGIFFNEPTTVCLTGMLISAYQTLHNENKNLLMRSRYETKK